MTANHVDGLFPRPEEAVGLGYAVTTVGIAVLPAPDGPFIHPRAAEPTKLSSSHNLVQLRRPSPQPALPCNRREPLLSGHSSDTAPHVCPFFARRASLHSPRVSLPRPVYSRLAGYEDLNDAGRVSADQTFRLIGSPKLWDRGAVLTSTLHWFETDLKRLPQEIPPGSTVCSSPVGSRSGARR